MAKLTRLNSSSNNSNNNNQEKEKNKFFMNLGFQTKDGSFIKLSGNIVIAVDKVLGEGKNLSKTNEEWNKKQRILNRAIEELNAIFSTLEDGEHCMLNEIEDAIALKKLTVQFVKANYSDNKELSEDAIASDELLAELL